MCTSSLMGPALQRMRRLARHSAGSPDAARLCAWAMSARRAALKRPVQLAIGPATVRPAPGSMARAQTRRLVRGCRLRAGAQAPPPLSPQAFGGAMPEALARLDQCDVSMAALNWRPDGREHPSIAGHLNAEGGASL